jgi:hypothetical protein
MFKNPALKTVCATVMKCATCIHPAPGTAKSNSAELLMAQGQARLGTILYR